MPRRGLSVFDLLDTPDLEGQILTHLTRNGPTEVAALPRLIGQDADHVRAALDALVGQGKIEISAEGQARIVFGQSRAAPG